MAKNDKPVSNKPSKMTVMLFQLEGSDETLQEGFRTINNAIDKLANPVVRVVGGPPPVPSLLASTNGADSDARTLDAEVVDEGTDAEGTPVERPKPARSSPSVPRQPKVLDLDLKAGSVPLRQ